jgi:hypothetical protein
MVRVVDLSEALTPVAKTTVPNEILIVAVVGPAKSQVTWNGCPASITAGTLTLARTLVGAPHSGSVLELVQIHALLEQLFPLPHVVNATHDRESDGALLEEHFELSGCGTWSLSRTHEIERV